MAKTNTPKPSTPKPSTPKPSTPKPSTPKSIPSHGNGGKITEVNGTGPRRPKK